MLGRRRRGLISIALLLLFLTVVLSIQVVNKLVTGATLSRLCEVRDMLTDYKSYYRGLIERVFGSRRDLNLTVRVDRPDYTIEAVRRVVLEEFNEGSGSCYLKTVSVKLYSEGVSVELSYEFIECQPTPSS